MFIRTLVFGLTNVLFAATVYGYLKLFPSGASQVPSGTAYKEAMVQAFASGATAALAGGFLTRAPIVGESETLVAAISGAIGSVLSGYEQGQSMRMLLTNAAIGFITSGALALVVGSILPGGFTMEVDEAASLAREAVNGVIILMPTLITTGGMEFIRENNPEMYRRLTE
jgi:hypothetical protein